MCSVIHQVTEQHVVVLLAAEQFLCEQPDQDLPVQCSPVSYTEFVSAIPKSCYCLFLCKSSSSCRFWKFYYKRLSIAEFKAIQSPIQEQFRLISKYRPWFEQLQTKKCQLKHRRHKCYPLLSQSL